MEEKKRIAKRISLNVALLAGFSSFYVVALKMLPGIPAIGLDVKIKIAVALSPIYGLVLGPILGPSSLILGTIMKMAIFPGEYGLFDYVTVFAAPLGALVSSLIFDARKFYGFPRWIYAATIYAILLTMWFMTDVGRLAAPYVIPYFASVALMVFNGVVGLGWGGSMRSTVLRIFSGCFAGIFADHLYGSLSAIIIFRYLLSSFLPEALALIYLSAIPIFLIERGLMVAFSFIVAVNLYRVLKKSDYLRVKVVE